MQVSKQHPQEGGQGSYFSSQKPHHSDETWPHYYHARHIACIKGERETLRICAVLLWWQGQPNCTGKPCLSAAGTTVLNTFKHPDATPADHEAQASSSASRAHATHVEQIWSRPAHQICLQGQRQQQFLTNICKKKNSKTKGICYQLPHKFGIQLDHHGNYNLIVRYKVTPTHLNNPLEVIQDTY